MSLLGIEQGDSAQEESSLKKEARQGCYPGNYFRLIHWPDQVLLLQRRMKKAQFMDVLLCCSMLVSRAPYVPVNKVFRLK